jgi:hypothetical protein
VIDPVLALARKGTAAVKLERRIPRLPPNLFGGAFELAGLGEAWQAAARHCSL